MSSFTLDDGRVVYDPTGRVDVDPVPLAPRVASLEGLRLGVLDNSKWNAGKLLRETVELLRPDGGFATVSHYTKHSFSSNAAPDLLERIVAEADVVVTAIGD